MKIIVLGSGGWIPTPERHTASYLIDTGNSLILLDTGTGICRLSAYQDLLSNYDEIHIIYSHYHLDHLMGLVYLSNWAKSKKIYFYGPGQTLGFLSCSAVITNFLKPPYFVNPDSIYKSIEFFDYSSEGFKIGTTEVGITKQIHRGGSFGITLDDILHYATDTLELEETFKKAQNVKLLLHECWELDRSDNAEHSSAEGIELMNSCYDIKQIGLIHINPNWDETTISILKKRVEDKNIMIVEDKMVFNY